MRDFFVFLALWYGYEGVRESVQVGLSICIPAVESAFEVLALATLLRGTMEGRIPYLSIISRWNSRSS